MHPRHGHISFTFLLDAFIHYEPANLGCRRIHSAEIEDVEEHETSVIDEVLDGFPREGEIRVGELGDVRDAVYAVDVGEDAGEC